MPERIGIRRGDVLLSLDGRPVAKEGDSPFAAAGTNLPELTMGTARRAAKLKVLRNDEETECGVPRGINGDDWEMDVVFMESVLDRVLSTPGTTENQAALVERAMHDAARLEWSPAIRAAEQAADSGLESADLLAFLGECSNHLPRYDRAEAFCRRALELDARNAVALRALAYAMTFAGRPDEAVELLECLRPLHEFDKNDRRVETMARVQLPWVDAAGTDAERMKRGILPDLCDPRTPRRDVPLSNLMDVVWDRLAILEDQKKYLYTLWTGDVISNAAVSARLSDFEIHRMRSRFRGAGFEFDDRIDYFCFGIMPNGDALFKSTQEFCRIIALECVKPGLEDNSIRVVRQGARYECFVNGVKVLTRYHNDEPARLSWSVNGVCITFEDLRLEVPDPNAAPPPEPVFQDRRDDVRVDDEETF